MMFKKAHDREIIIADFDKEQLKRDEVNLFVKNLGESATNASLYSLFKSYGNIFCSKLAQNIKGESKGYGYVQYMLPEQAKQAINEMNGKKYNDIKLVVEHYKRREKQDAIASKYTNLYVKNLPPSVTSEEALGKLFEGYGKRVSVSISQSELEGKIGYFGFVAFERSEDATMAVREMNGKKIEGATLYVGKALSKEQRERHKRIAIMQSKDKMRKLTLFVKSITSEALSEEFVKGQLDEYGEIKQINILTRKDNEGKNVNLPIAFVVFEKEEDVKKALLEYHKKSRPLVITQLEKKEVRQERLRQARNMKNKTINDIQSKYIPMLQQLHGRVVQGNEAYLNPPLANFPGTRPRIRPFYQLQSIVHSRPQKLAVPLV